MAMKMMILVVALASLMQSVHSAQFVVGDAAGWTVEANYTSWALKNIYHPGDTLLFNYPAQRHSVLEVNRNAFDNCLKESPINHHSDGKTLIRLSRPGPHWFICGVPGHCEQGQKFGIMVTAGSTSPNVPPATTTPVAAAPPHHQSAPSPHQRSAPSPNGHGPSVSHKAPERHAPAPAPAPLAGNSALSASGFSLFVASSSLMILLLV